MNFFIKKQQNIGDRPYQEDYLCEVNGPDFEAVGVFDGHGGTDAAEYASKNLIPTISRHPSFKDDLQKAIRASYQKIHFEMWAQQEQWPLVNNYLSPAGTTATIAIIRDDLITIGHCGDSAAVIKTGNGNPTVRKLTNEHKPEGAELVRIQNAGGRVVNERVVWFRTRDHYHLRNTVFYEHRCLNMSRSLGDFWSFNERSGKFIVSYEPEITEFKINDSFERLILGSDGLFDNMDPETAVRIAGKSKRLAAAYLVKHALDACRQKKRQSDNVSAIVVSRA